MLKSILASAGVAAIAIIPVSASAQGPEIATASAATTAMPQDSEFNIFAPGERTNPSQIDYTAWSQAMTYLVYPMGRSLREGSPRPQASIGSRRIFGHDSRYRLEGNRVMFSFFNDELRAMVSDYRQELQDLGGQIDISTLPRNEQLAYWFNLHNVAVMETIANEWPVRQPRDIEIGGVPFDQAKFITVNGVSMSPHDIRHQIVFRHWEDPKVIYGFWRGDIGGPSIASDAFSGINVAAILDRQAREFVNSLRGTQKRGDLLEVSTIYDEARPYYFSDWPRDIRAHITAFAETEVGEILAETNQTEATIEEADIADLAGGVREPSYSYVTTQIDGVDRPASFRIPRGTARLLNEQGRKLQKIRREGRTGTVIFNPITLPGEEEDDGEVD